MHESVDSLSAQQIQSCLTFLDKASSWENLHAPVQEPPNFASRAWPAYLACIRNHSYYFSVAEIVVIASGAGRNVAIFKSTNGNLIYEAGYYQGRGHIICIKLAADNRCRVRSHFERIITASSADDLIAASRADKEARFAQERRQRELEEARQEEEERRREVVRTTRLGEERRQRELEEKRQAETVERAEIMEAERQEDKRRAEHVENKGCEELMAAKRRMLDTLRLKNVDDQVNQLSSSQCDSKVPQKYNVHTQHKDEEDSDEDFNRHFDSVRLQRKRADWLSTFRICVDSSLPQKNDL